MSQETPSADRKSNRKLAAANIVMVATAFVWYLLAFNGLKELLSNSGASSDQTLLIIGINTGAIVISGLIGSLIVSKLKNRRRFLTLWLVSGVIISLIPLGLNLSNLTQLSIVSAIFGIYFGIGMPTTMGYHSSYSKIESRAKLGGFTFLIIGTSFAFSSIIQVSTSFWLYLLLAVMRLFSLGVFHFAHVEKEPTKTMKVQYRSIVTNRSFMLYFVPWLMFSLINFMTMPIQIKIYPSEASFSFLTAMENIVIAIVAVVSGFIADKWGRKRLIIIGFIMIGIGYAVIGLFSNDLAFSSIIFTITDGTAWGIFYVLFLFTIWGDLGHLGYSDKFYLLGALPYVSSYFMRQLFTPYLQGIDVNLIFSFASVFLFLSVLPLIYAPETLPEKVMKDRDLQSYILNAKKKAAKETVKADKKKKPTEDDQTTENEPNENDASYEEAKKLAEKYY
jgi:MFS family permease